MVLILVRIIQLNQMFGGNINGKAQRCVTLAVAAMMCLTILLFVAFEGHIDKTMMLLMPGKAVDLTAISR